MPRQDPMNAVGRPDEAGSVVQSKGGSQNLRAANEHQRGSGQTVERQLSSPYPSLRNTLSTM